MNDALLSFEQAAAVVAARAHELCPGKPAAVRIDLASAVGCVLAESLRADRDQPPFARSTRDGFACRAAEAAAQEPLAIAGATRAGDAPAGPLLPGTAWEIMTGAPVPAGADAVVMVEHVEAAGTQIRLQPSRKVAPGENIVAQGEDARAGDELVPEGTRLGPAHIALAAACGYSTLSVYARPRVALLSTGDELVPVEASPGPGQIRNSNGPMLAALVAAAGGEPCLLPPAPDDAEALDAALGRAARTDLLLITGGVSVGKFDLVEEALARAGARFHFTGVRIQPGKPVVFGELPRSGRTADGERIQPFFGLPGNPISSAVTFLLFAATTLAALAGNRERNPRFALARLSKDCKGKPGLTRFVPAFCTFSPPYGQIPEVAAVGWSGSGDLAAFARSNCLLVVPEDADKLESGAIVRILLL
jgi:molybdopterin molybdotransferase